MMEEAVAEFFPLIISLAFAILVVLSVCTVGIIKRVTCERTKRELFAYVAEGTIDPQTATRMLEASDVNSFRNQIARGVSWGCVSAKNAERVLAAGDRAKPA